MVIPPTAAEIVEQLTRLLDTRLLDPLEILLATDTDANAGLAALRRAGHGRAIGWAADLLDGDDQRAAATAARLIGTLYPGDGPFEPPAEWWATPLGQVVAHRVGHPGAHVVSYPVAGAMLGITRQGVHDLVNRGKLERHPDGGVLVASVRARLTEAAHR